MKSGMNYNLVQDLIEEINKRQAEIKKTLEDLATSMPSKLEQSYVGDAATQYNTTLKNVSTQINEIIEDLLVKLQNEANRRQADYERKTKELADTSNTGVQAA